MASSWNLVGVFDDAITEVPALLSDICIRVRSTDAARLQEFHSFCGGDTPCGWIEPAMCITGAVAARGVAS